MSPVVFWLKSRTKGEKAYEEAEKLAKLIMDFVAIAEDAGRRCSGA